MTKIFLTRFTSHTGEPSSSFKERLAEGPGGMSSAVRTLGSLCAKGCPLGVRGALGRPDCSEQGSCRSFAGSWLLGTATPEPEPTPEMSVLLDAHKTIPCFKQEDSNVKRKRQFSNPTA